MKIRDLPGFDKFAGFGWRRRRWCRSFEEGSCRFLPGSVQAGQGFLGDHLDKVLKVPSANVVGVLAGTIHPTEVVLDVFVSPGLACSTQMIGIEHLIGLGQGV